MLSANQQPIPALASLQQDQGQSNNCGILSACQALNLLYGSNLVGSYWAGVFDRMPFPSILTYRCLRNGPTLPYQQTRQIQYIARQSGLPTPTIQILSSNPAELRAILAKPNMAAIVTIGWINTVGPKIMIGKTTINRNRSERGSSYHTMLLGAYDPLHISEDGILRPWGFVNSWSAPGKDLFWISDGEFVRAWAHYTPTAGINPLVLIQS